MSLHTTSDGKPDVDVLPFKAITEISDAVYDTAYRHGWYEEDRTFGDRIALCHSELSEALEEFRNGHHLSEVRWEHAKDCSVNNVEGFPCSCTPKPEGVPIELADVMIRIMDMASAENIDLAGAVRTKMIYNETRPYRHGGKAL